jgi:hypothetical protein
MNIIDRRINGTEDSFLGIASIGSALGGIVGKGLDNRRAKKDREANAKLSADNVEIERLRLQQEQERAKAAAAQAPRLTGASANLSSNKKMYWIGGGVAAFVLVIVLVFAFK